MTEINVSAIIVARVAGRRQSVHRLADDEELMGRCHVDEAKVGSYLTIPEFSEIVETQSRRLCGHCYPVVDRD